MATNKLNQKYCETAPPGEHYDGGGLFLLVKKDGRRYWRLAASVNGKRKLLGLGNFREVTLAEARRERERLRALVRQGIDPVEQKRELRQSAIDGARQEERERGFLFEQLTRALVESKRGRTTEEYRLKFLRQFEIHVFPQLGHKSIKEIGGQELLALFRGVGEKTNHLRPMTYMAKRLAQWTGEIFQFASLQDMDFSANPIPAVLRHLEKHETRKMRRIGFKELAAFLEALGRADVSDETRSAIWLLLWTGQRQVSAREATWADFDLQEGIWTRKGEKGDKGVHYLPLPRQAIELLKELQDSSGGATDDFVFPSPRRRGGGKKISEATITQAIQRMGFDMVGHGLRAVVSTGLNELGYDNNLVDLQLGHALPIVEGAYNDAVKFGFRREMMQRWADYLDSLRGGGK